MWPTFTRTPTCYCLHRNPVAAMETLQETFETQPWLDQFALYYHSLPIFPVFGSVHFILTAFALRREPGKQRALHVYLSQVAAILSPMCGV